MRIALYSHVFPPHVGGSGIHTKLLAEGFADRGHAVTVITSTPSNVEETNYPFRLVRRPILRELHAVLARSDLVLDIGPCLKAGFLARAMRKPLVIVHPMFPAQGVRGLAARVLCARVPNIAPSKAVADALPISATVIPNPHDESVFRKWIATDDRTRDVVFVGRLIEAKGLRNVLLSLDLLRKRGLVLSLTVVGSGPEADACREISRALHLDNQVAFVGAASPARLADIYNAHRIAVVPSVCEEGFGLVALEAIACGCAVVGSISGGLPEAIGPCGITYPKASIHDLASRLEQLIIEPQLVDVMQSYAKHHLAKHTRRAVAAGYLSFINGCFPHLAFPERRSAHCGADSIGLVRRANG
jgi:glycosyltransferase involved in cell wall biosynthesis